MKFSRITAVVFSLILLFLLPSCQSSNESKNDIYKPVTVFGVTFTSAPTAVVSLSPYTTEMMLQLGLSDQLSACTDDCVLPKDSKIVSVGDGSEPNFDTVLAVKPDLLLSQRSLSKADLDRLNQAGIKALIIPPAEDLRELESYYSALAAVFYGEEKGIGKAESTINPLVRAANVLRDELKNERKNVTFIYYLTLGKSAATADTFAGDLLSCLGENKAEGKDGHIDFAKAKESNPTYLFVSKPYALENLQSSPDWNTFSSVANRKVLSFDSSLFERRSPDLAEFLIETAKTIYPDKADEIDQAYKAAVTEYPTDSDESSSASPSAEQSQSVS